MSERRKYWCWREERHYTRTRLQGGAKEWVGVPSFLHTHVCYGCESTDCHENIHKGVTA